MRKKQNALEDWQKLKIEAYLETQPQIKILYEITQDLMSLMNEKMCKYNDCKRRLIPKLLKYIELLKDCGFVLFRKLGKTIENWQEEIGRMF